MNFCRNVFALLSAFSLMCTLACPQTTVQGIDTVSGPAMSTISVTGTVQLSTAEENAKLPPDIRISVNCHGDVSDGGTVSLGGQYRFVLTPSPLALSTICSIEAKAFGYDSTMGKFPVRSVSGLVSLDPITITRSAHGATPKERSAATVSATSLKAPPNAMKLFDHGVKSLQQQKFSDAVKDFEGAVKIYADYAEAWLNLGRARVSTDALGPARDAFIRAAELDPQMAGPPAELGLLAARQGDVVTAARYLDESMRLDPGNTYQTCYSDALVNFVLKRYDVAERSARAALRFGDTPAQARAGYLLGMALLALGNNAEARQRLTHYLELAPKAPEHDQIMKELARVDQLAAGK